MAVGSGTSLLEVSRRVSLTLKLDGCEALLLKGSATTTVVSTVVADRRGLEEPRRSSLEGERARPPGSEPVVAGCGMDICLTAAMARCATATRWSPQEHTSFWGLASLTRSLGHRVTVRCSSQGRGDQLRHAGTDSGDVGIVGQHWTQFCKGLQCGNKRQFLVSSHSYYL